MERELEYPRQPTLYLGYSELNWIGIIAGLFLLDILDIIGEHVHVPQTVVMIILGSIFVCLIAYSLIYMPVPSWQFFGGMNAGLWVKWAGDPLFSKALHLTVTEVFFVLLSVSAASALVARQRISDTERPVRDILWSKSWRAFLAAIAFNLTALLCYSFAANWAPWYVAFGFVMIPTAYFTYRSFVFVRYELTSRIFEGSEDQVLKFNTIL